MKLTTYRELLELSDLSNVYARTKPLVLESDDFDRINHTFFEDVKVKKDNDFTINKICSDNKIYFLMEPESKILFSNGGVEHTFDKGDMILISAGTNLNSNKWSFEKVDDLLNFNKDFESVSYNDYDIEKESIDSLKRFKCELLKGTLEDKYKKDLLELKEKSSISFNLKISR